MSLRKFYRMCCSTVAIAAYIGVCSNSYAMGGQYGLEFAIDAPWRLEPTRMESGQLHYGAIPIVIEFADAIFEANRSVAASTVFKKIVVGSAKEVRIREYSSTTPNIVAAETVVPVAAFQEIERKLEMSTLAREPSSELCRPASRQDCTALYEITNTHEWHAALWYKPRLPIEPGRNILLEVTLVTERPASTSDRQHPGPQPTSPASRPSLTEQPNFSTPPGTVTLKWTNSLAIHAGEAPLPRFATDWLYGDFHYHSQMTDNEGETGYSYRNVVRALGAVGMDFVFATDHASNSVQVSSNNEARDLNPHRFSKAKSIIYGPDGANEAIAREVATGDFARVNNGKVLPQIYVGEEVDAQPEISEQEFRSGLINYGDRRSYPWFRMGLCAAIPLDINYVPPSQPGRSLSAPLPSGKACRSRFSRPVPSEGTHLLYDLQGAVLTDEFSSRQHSVYFPFDTSLDSTGFIGSDTGKFGGARKRLATIIREVERGGVAFLAHPLEGMKPDSDHGPDIVPYSDFQLTQAWRSPAILGLQFWNENQRLKSETSDADAVMKLSTVVNNDVVAQYGFDFRWPYRAQQTNDPRWTWQKFNLWRDSAWYLYQGASTWDRYLRKGLDPAQTRDIPWLSPDEPRRWFVAAGSDSHGDLNFRRHGRPACFNHLKRWCEDKISDTAIGNPRNLVSMSKRSTAGVAGVSIDEETSPNNTVRRYTNREAIEAIRTGNFTATDGPALRVVIDRNRNGKIDTDDFPMGSLVDFYPGEHIPILIEWATTREFGPIEQVDIYVGNKEVTFAAPNHGPIVVAEYPGGNPRLGAYRADPSATLQIRPDVAAQYHGVAKLFIAPGQFQLAEQEKGLFYVRAFAKTVSAQSDWFAARNCAFSADAGNRCGDRFALANPVWGRYHKTCPVKPSAVSSPVAVTQGRHNAFLDANNNGYPDICESVVLNPCVPHAATGGGPGSGTFETNRPHGAGSTVRAGAPVRPVAPAAVEAAAHPSSEKPTPTKSCRTIVSL